MDLPAHIEEELEARRLDGQIDDYYEEQYRKQMGYPPEDLWDTPPPVLILKEVEDG